MISASIKIQTANQCDSSTAQRVEPVYYNIFTNKRRIDAKTISGFQNIIFSGKEKTYYDWETNIRNPENYIEKPRSTKVSIIMINISNSIILL